MKIKVQFTFEGEIPEKYKDLAILYWGDNGVKVSLTKVEGEIDVHMVLSLLPSRVLLLKTKCVGYDVLEVS